MLKINHLKLSQKISERWEEEKLFYPSECDVLEIREVAPKKMNLLFIKIENLPEGCWVFDNEYDNSHKDKNKQAGSLSSAGKKVEKTLIWEDDKRLRVLLIEMKTDLTFKNVAECVNKMESSLNTISTFLAAHPKFQYLEKIISPMGLVCYNLEGFQYQNTGYLDKGETVHNFKKQYVDKKLREFQLAIHPITLIPMPIPVAFRINPTFEQDSQGFTLDFSEIYQKLKTI